MQMNTPFHDFKNGIENTLNDTLKPFNTDYDYLNDEPPHAEVENDQKKDSLRKLILITGVFVVVCVAISFIV